MDFLFDTTAFSDLMREHPGLDAHLATISPTDVCVYRQSMQEYQLPLIMGIVEGPLA